MNIVATQNMPRYLIIHGHFYQPPRENPWTGLVENQKSAYPYHDWNEKIKSECYSPNTDANILDERGKKIGSLNNFSMMSFNIGPTLAGWLEKNDIKTYDRIIEGDRISLSRCGFGNAIAQVYNHIILPLADRRDKETEIIWGIADFKKRFKREPLGIWLSETAIDEKTIEALLDFNMKFVLLSPIQAAAVYDKKINKWKDVSDGKIDTTVPYKITDKKGRTINCLFFDSELSWGVSFSDLLSSAKKLADKIEERKNEGKGNLSFICTDGETFGHHKPFSEMCLSHLFEIESQKRNIKIVNPSYYFSLFPPEIEVKLKKGGSSWSCPHGVERWRGDCGCATEFNSGWNQKWRKGLRDSLNKLKKEINKIYEKETASFIPFPWKLRNEYIDSILTGILPNDVILKESKREIMQTEMRRAISLLEAEKNVLFSFTSCGWFFSDISGLEAVQNLRYAARAIFLSQSYDKIRNSIIKILKTVKSNKDRITGEDIFAKILKEDGTTYHKWIHALSLMQLIKSRDSISLPKFKINIIEKYFNEIEIDVVMIQAKIIVKSTGVEKLFLVKSSISTFTSMVKEMQIIGKPLSAISIFDSLAEGFYTFSLRDIDYDFFTEMMQHYLLNREINIPLLINIFDYLTEGVILKDLYKVALSIYKDRIANIKATDKGQAQSLLKIKEFFGQKSM